MTNTNRTEKCFKGYAVSKVVEDEIKEKLRMIEPFSGYGKPELSHGEDNAKDIYFPNGIKIEVKDNEKCITSGNVCIEVEQYSERTKGWIDSGIVTSPSQYWINIAYDGSKDKQVIMLIKTEALKTICLKHLSKGKPCGDWLSHGKAARGLMIPWRTVLAQSIVIS